MPSRLAQRVAVVTGATSGIGRAIAELFADEGAQVVLVGRDDPRGRAVASAIGDRGGRAAFVRADLSRTVDLRRVVDEAVAEHGAIDVLVNAAGFNEPGTRDQLLGPSGSLTEDTFDGLCRVNLKAVYFLTVAALEHMAERGRGRVVNVSSTVASRPAGGAAYAATKAGVEALTQAWAAEYGPHGINVNAVAPGTTSTPFTASFVRDAPSLEAHLLETPKRRIATPLDVARVALFLACEESEHVTGVTVRVDGGKALT